MDSSDRAVLKVQFPLRSSVCWWKAGGGAKFRDLNLKGKFNQYLIYSDC